MDKAYVPGVKVWFISLSLTFSFVCDLLVDTGILSSPPPSIHICDHSLVCTFLL